MIITCMRGKHRAICSVKGNAKVNGKAQNSRLHPPECFNQFRYRFLGLDAQNLVCIDSVVAAVRMREKNAFRCETFLLTRPLHLSRYSSRLHHSFMTILTLYKVRNLSK